MSATIPENMRLDDLLKATGYDCPEALQGKTFNQATEGGGGGAVLEDNKEVTITQNGTTIITPSAGKDGMKKVTATVNVSGGGSEEIHQIVVASEINQGTSQSFSFGSSWDNSSFQYITMGSGVFKIGFSSAVGKITREQILGASSGDKFSLTDGTLTLTLTITSAYESEGEIFVEGSVTGSGYAVGAGTPCLVYVY